MADLNSYKGKFAEALLNPEHSRFLPTLVASAIAKELEMTVSELKMLNLHAIVGHELGSEFFKNLSFRLSEMEKNKDLSGENLSLQLRLVINPQRMKSMIIDSPTFGVESLFTSLQFFEYMKSELAMALKNDGCLLDIFSQSSKIAPFVQNLVHVFNFDELEPLLGIIATHLLDLANKGNGLSNLRMFLKLGSSPIVLPIASHKPEVEAMLVQKISGLFFHFATHKYANHLVQSADDSGTDSTASFVMDSLSGDFRILMDHCYGNYVLQSIISRSASIDLPLFYCLFSKIKKRRVKPEANVWGREVTTTMKKTLRSKGLSLSF
ncbi:unnamed protein product [Arabidopsis arenosa]|uniref:Uncharacterized protein n=1 Tax=Arabidopsis arenosa TaxID=38785 RepID=A0A8S1ZZX4_ARAAE|nr:unnamed protein product [Arabidopsis arenosa]